MAVAIQLTAIAFPEVLAAMDTPICRRHRIPMIEVDGFQGCFRCPKPDCNNAADMPPRNDAGQAPPGDGDGPARHHAPEDSYRCQSWNWVGEARAFNAIPAHLKSAGIFGPISQVPQSNARTDLSIMAGPSAPGGSRKSGRRQKRKRKAGQKLSGSPWGGEGGTNSK